VTHSNNKKKGGKEGLRMNTGYDVECCNAAVAQSGCVRLERMAAAQGCITAVSGIERNVCLCLWGGMNKRRWCSGYGGAMASGDKKVCVCVGEEGEGGLKGV